MTNQVIPPEAVEGIWYDERIVSIPTGDAATDAAYRMERASHDYSLPQSTTVGGPK